MTALNAGAQRAMEGLAVHGCTDITGFGLLGHAAEMAQGSNLSLRLMAGTLPLLPQARELAQEGIIPAGAYRNRAHLEGKVSFHAAVPLDVADIMFDPQTAGGLLISVAPQDAERLLDALGQQASKTPASSGKSARPKTNTSWWNSDPYRFGIPHGVCP